MTKKYTVVRLQLKNDSTASFDWDQLIALATQNYNCQGVVEFDLKESQIDAVLGERAYAGVNLPAPERAELEQQGIALDSGLQFFFYQEQHIQHASIFSDYINSNHSNLQVSSQQSDWQDWNQGFRDNFKALQISSGIEVVPAWEQGEDRGREVDHFRIYINPGMGFGTGSHETTALCLYYLDQVIRQHLQPGEPCLDFGCGSGILGVAAIGMCGLHLDFCDIDREALDNCQQNILINFPQQDLSNHRLVARDRFKLEHPYKVVFANILESILLEERELIISAVSPGGFLVLSGVLEAQVEGVKEAYIKSGQLEMVDSKIRGEWGALLLQRSLR